MNSDFSLYVFDQIVDHLPPTFRRVGNKYNGRCPFCGDSHKNANKKRGWIYADGSYYCFNCGLSMSGAALLSKLADTDFNTIRADFFKQQIHNGNYSLSSTALSGVITKPSIPEFAPVVKPEWKNSLSDAAKAYLDNRYVTSAPFIDDTQFFSTYDKHGREFILIPWEINGVEAYFQLNDFNKYDKNGRKYMFPPRLPKLIFGLDKIDLTFPYIFLFEGVYDSLFVPNGVALGGKNLSALQKEIITKRYPHHKLVFALDNDIPGLTSIAKTIKSNEYKYWKWFDESTTVKDINDAVKQSKDVNMFADKDKICSNIIDAGIMQMVLLQKGINIP